MVVRLICKIEIFIDVKEAVQKLFGSLFYFVTFDCSRYVHQTSFVDEVNNYKL